MILRLLKTATISTLLGLPMLLPAQTETTGKEEQRLETLARNEGQMLIPRTKLSIGFRMLNSGGTVDFRNLGVVPSIREIAPVGDGAVTRTYDNGIVYADSLRTEERAADGSQSSVPGSRYLVTATASDGTTIVTNDNVSYTPGLTREWETHTATQFNRPGYASFNNYGATSDGGSARSEQGATTGAEFQLAREIGRGSRHFQWSLVAGLTLNDINGKTAGTVSSSLNIHTDYYAYSTALGQPAPSGIYLASNYTELLDSNGVQINPFGLETTVPLFAVSNPSLSTDSVLPGAVIVTGNWQVKGSYFMLRLGPSLRAQLTERLGLSASLGIAGAYAGTRYSATEYFTNPDKSSELIQTPEALNSTANKFLPGYYADIILEWAANDTLGLFGGISSQQLDSYEQKLGDRIANIDLGTAVGIRGGVTIRF